MPNRLCWEPWTVPLSNQKFKERRWGSDAKEPVDREGKRGGKVRPTHRVTMRPHGPQVSPRSPCTLECSAETRRPGQQHKDHRMRAIASAQGVSQGASRIVLRGPYPSHAPSGAAETLRAGWSPPCAYVWAGPAATLALTSLLLSGYSTEHVNSPFSAFLHPRPLFWQPKWSRLCNQGQNVAPNGGGTVFL